MTDATLGPAAEQLIQSVLTQRQQAYAAAQQAEASYQAVLKALAEAHGVGVVELEIAYRLVPPAQPAPIEVVSDAD